MVNGKIAILGQKADPAVDRIEVDGKVIEERREMLYYLMHKPAGVITENINSFSRFFVSAQNQNNFPLAKKRKNEAVKQHVRTVRDLLPPHLQGKIYPVGRLDQDSSGLLLLTNDGVLAYRLTHPKFDHEKEYEVTVDQPITDGQLRKLREGVKVLGEKTKPATVVRLGPAQFRIALTEGRNRQIRRMCQKVGLHVVRLVRTRIVTMQDRRLKAGVSRPLLSQEVVLLLRAVGI
jgi:pseudouridine synthase